MRSPPAPPDTLLFDLDGTITDTDELHFKATRQALSGYELNIDRRTYMDVVYGAPNEAIATHFFPDGNAAIRHAYIENKEQAYRELITSLDPTAGLMNVFAWADEHAAGLALVSNAPRENMERVLGALGLQERFDTIVLAEDLPVGKPDPLPYVTAMENLGTTPDRALGFEDSEPGLRALQGAGVFAIGLASALSVDVLSGFGADLAITDFTAPALWEVLQPRCGEEPQA